MTMDSASGPGPHPSTPDHPAGSPEQGRVDPLVSVIVPTLNEEARIGSCLGSIGGNSDVEIVVSDGGSTDATIEIVRTRCPGAVVVEGPPGRGGQLNLGAAAAAANRLLFLHADCRLPVGWFGAVMEALDEGAAMLVVFRLRTEPADGSLPRTWRRIWLALFDLRSRGWGLPYGDQGFAMRREVFDGLGGFSDIPLMEDLALARRCRQRRGIVHLPLEVRTSARRFERHPVRSRLILACFPTLFRLGVAPATLARWYGNVR